MAVPSSGQLRLRGDIALEVDGVATGTNVSLRTLSAAAGFSTPDNMSEFYGYSSVVLASVQTNGSSNTTETSTTIYGNVSNSGGGTVTQRGFYFGTNSSNATSNVKYNVGSGTGSFSLNRTGLNSNTTYYYWAFATNEAGTSIASRGTVTTIPTFVPQLIPYTTTYYSNLGFYSVWNSTYTGAVGYINPYTGAYVTTDTGVASSYSLDVKREGFRYTLNAVNWNRGTNPSSGAIFCDFSASGRADLAHHIDANYTPQPFGTYNVFNYYTNNYPYQLQARADLNSSLPMDTGYKWRFVDN